MESIPSLSQALRTLIFEEAPRLAKEHRLIKRNRCFSASSLLLVLVLGWLQHPLAGPSQLARFAHTVGVNVSKQAIAERLTEQTAGWLRGVLEVAVATILFASSQAQGLLARFPAVILEDASSVQLPEALAFLAERMWRWWVGLFHQVGSSLGSPLWSPPGATLARWQGPRNAQSSSCALPSRGRCLDR